MIGRRYDELIEVVAQKTLDCTFTMWGFGEGPALLGLLRAGQRLHRPALIDHVAELVHPCLLRGAAPTDHLIPVEALDALHHLRPSIDVTAGVHKFQEALCSAARPVAGQPAVHRPDLPAWATTVWVDCMHTDIPGAVLLGQPSTARTLADEFGKALQDRSGLFAHGYDVRAKTSNQVHWGRGQGWALHGLIGAPPGPTTEKRIDAVLAALQRHEQDGRWNTVVDDPRSPQEHSVSALVAAAVLRLHNHGRAQHHFGMGRRALDAAVAALDTGGGLAVSGATPVGDERTYIDQPTGVWPWGQGPLLLALLEAQATR